ncbi:MAG: DUF3830 family protein [Candidatus Hodarchaeota archaeon]
MERDLEKLMAQWDKAYSQFRRVLYPSPDGRKFEIILNGVTAKGILLDKAASKTCEALWKSLPVKGHAIHASWSGEMCRYLEAVDIPVSEYENRMCRCAPGNLTYDPELKELAWAYGLNDFRLPEGPISITICGMITENLDEFAKMCARTKLQGALEVEVRRSE